MRTDVIIDRKQVKLRNASTIGFKKHKAQFGDIVRTEEYIGRVIGRIAYAPKLEANAPDVRNWLVVVAIGRDMSYPMERWINPAFVLDCYDPQCEGMGNPAEFLAFMFGESFRKYKTQDLRAWSSYGTNKIERYMAAKLEREALLGHPVSHIG